MKGEEIKELFIVGIDIAGYSLKALEAQHGAQLNVDRALNEAVKAISTGKKRGDPEWLDAGDGGYALFEWNSGLEILDLIESMTETLRRENASRTSDAQVSVRVALHCGKVVCWKTVKGSKRFTSNAINECARYLAGMARDPGRVVCSKAFLDRATALNPVVTAIRLKDVKDKHGLAHEVYNLHRIPGLGLQPNAIELYQHPFV